MPTIGSITKTVRINPDDISILSDIMRRNNLTWSGVIHYLIENRGVPQIDKGVPQKSEKSAVGCTPKDNTGVPQEFLQMLHDLRMPLSDFITEITNLIDSGCLMNENGHLVSKEQGIDLSGFIEICHDANIDPQGAIDKAAKMLTKGK